ncbi:NADH dehydrogenase subunit 5 [Roseibium sp. TrichSKD4]|nr:NADH dehydrogenase subunit 5 [Roseibium sp. TrichSKD4]
MIDYSWAMSIIFISFGLICMLNFEGSIPNRGLFFLAICMPIIG